MERFLIHFTFWQHRALYSIGHGGQRRMGDISWVKFELQQIITIITIIKICTITTITTIITIMMTFNETGTYICYYVQQFFGLFLGCCIVHKKRKYLAFWSRDVLSLTFQAFPLNKSTEWWERGWSKSSSRHVSAVQISHSLKGLTWSDVLDHLWNRDWAYLSNWNAWNRVPEFDLEKARSLWSLQENWRV